MQGGRQGGREGGREGKVEKKYERGMGGRESTKTRTTQQMNTYIYICILYIYI